MVDEQQNKSRGTSEKGQLTDAISTEHRGTITSRNEPLTAVLYAFYSVTVKQVMYLLIQEVDGLMD
jgi:hypothetical protein